MIEYMANHQKGTIIYQTDDTRITNHTLLYTVNELCMKHLSTYEGYRESVKRVHEIKELIPIYLCETLQLIPTKRFKEYDNIYYNYAAIDHYHKVDNGIEIHFISGRKLVIEQTQSFFIKQLEKLAKIRNTKVKHFH